MKVDLKRVGDLVTLEAEGSPEDLAAFCRLSGLDVEGRGVMIPGPKGDKGEAGPAGPQGAPAMPATLGGIFGQCGCGCPAGAESTCGSSGRPRRRFQWGRVTCDVATGGGHPSYGGTMLFHATGGNAEVAQTVSAMQKAGAEASSTSSVHGYGAT